jgi:hypothetical protein
MSRGYASLAQRFEAVVAIMNEGELRHSLGVLLRLFAEKGLPVGAQLAPHQQALLREQFLLDELDDDEVVRFAEEAQRQVKRRGLTVTVAETKPVRKIPLKTKIA